MSARLSRRLVAATTLTAATAVGATLVPFTAHAAEVGSATAPLTFVSGQPQPSGPLTRGGASESFTFTVKNASDKPQEFRGTVFGEADGPTPINQTHVDLDVQALSAPATRTHVGSQDAALLGSFFPAGKNAGTSFQVPAKGQLSWKVTVGLGKDYPSNDGNLKLMFDGSPDDVRNPRGGDVTFKVDPAGRGGTLEEKFTVGKDDVLRLNKTTEIDLTLHARGEGSFDRGLGTTVELLQGAAKLPKVELKVYEHGQWVRPSKIDDVTWGLPVMDRGFGNGATHRYKLRLTVLDLNGIGKDTTVGLRSWTHVVAGNTYPIAGADAVLPLKVAKNGTKPSAAPSPSKAKPAAPAAATSSSATSAGGATTAASASSASSASSGTAVTSGDAGTTTGALARTGSSVSVWYAAGAAAVLLAAGGALTALRLRRR